jgi:hypothetical protein
MFSIYTVIGFAVSTGCFGYFIGLLHGLTVGREAERQDNYNRMISKAPE